MATTPELIAFVRQQFAAGASRETLRSVLAAQGWVVEDIDSAMALADPAGAGRASLVPIPSVAGASQVVSAGTVTPAPPNDAPVRIRPSSGLAGRVAGIGLSVVIVLGLLGGTAYAYLQKLGPFNRPPYTEATLVRGIAAASAGITSLSFSASTTMAIVPRAPGDEPFIATTSPDVAAAYARDYARAQNVAHILSYLQFGASNYSLPLTAIQAKLTAKSLGVDSSTILDPSTEKPYAFTSTSGGKNFALTVSFETPEAVTAIQHSPLYATSTTMVHDTTITFTKGSSAWFSVQKGPPLPSIVQLQNDLASLSTDSNGTLSISGAADWSLITPAWQATVDAHGLLGGIGLAFGFDVLGKDDKYYARINEIPSLFQAFLPIPKGEWIEADAATASSSVAAALAQSGALSQASSTDQNYAKDMTKVKTYFSDLTDSISSTRLIAFVNPPYAEQVGSERLYRYDLTVNKDAVVPFYNAAFAAAKKDLGSDKVSDADLQKALAYAQSDEFSRLLAYAQAHSMFTLWVDSQGVPRVLNVSVTVVPPSTAAQLNDKSVVIDYRISLSDINQHPTITAPASSTPIESVMAQTQSARSNGSRAAGQ